MEPSGATLGKGWRIAARLRIIVAAPLVAVFGFAGLALANTIGQAQAAGRLGDYVALATDAGNLAYQLQLERAAAADLLTGGGQNQLDAFNQQTGRSDVWAADYQRQRASAGTSVPAAPRAILDRLGDQLGRLGQLREQVRFGQQASVSATTFGYRIIVADLLSYRESVAQAAASAGVADNMRAAAALAQAIEAVGQQQVAVVRTIAAGQLTPAMQSDIIGTRADFTESSLSFLTLAPATWRAWWEQANTGVAPLSAQKLQDQIARAAPGQPLQLDAGAWIAAMNAWTGRIFGLEQRVDQTVLAEVEQARRSQVNRAAVEAAATALALLLTILVTTVVARRISRRLERLRDTANEVAFSKLPAVVEELRLADPATVRPDQAADRAAPYPERVTGDEIGEVQLAFAHVHRAAVRTAAEQAVMRANMAEIFVHLSRREQRLVDSVLAQVDEVERDETSPQRLESLYKLDNLATRMARINSSLLVLGGVGAGRVRHEDVPLVKVLQAALSQVEHYRRVRIGMIDDGVALAAEAVDEIVHLLAELLDNATLYSPPDSEAWMTARALHDRVVIQIGDEGVGLPSSRRDELNALLRRPPAIDVAAVRAMGLTVVGHLATRYGVRVELRPGPKLGTIAEVNIPLTLTRSTPGIAALVSGTSGSAAVPGKPVARNATGGAGAALAAGPGGAGIYGSAANGSAANGSAANGAGRGGSAANGVGAKGAAANGAGSKGTGAGAGRNGTGPARAAGTRSNSAGAPPSVAGPRPGEEWGPGARPGRDGDGRPKDADARPKDTDARPKDTDGHPRDGAGRPADAAGSTDAARAEDPAELPAPPPSVPSPDADDTAELPIFYQVSGWFRAEVGAQEVAEWHAPADETWRQAERATAEVPPAQTTTSGLPVRIPRQHLIPGGVEVPPERAPGADRRDPDRVAAAMAAYARGVATRRPSAATAQTD